MVDPRAENAQLRQALAQQQQATAQLQMVLQQRAEPILTAAIDALDMLAQAAEQGHTGSRELLARWVRVQQRAQDASSRLAVVRNGAGPQ